MTEVRFAVGSPNGDHSTIWKVWTSSKDDVYLQSRGMGGDFKISLHKSGACQLSRPVPTPGEPNASRHFQKWTRAPVATPFGPGGRDHVVSILFPRGDLREVQEDMRKPVTWLPLPPEGQVLSVSLYLGEASATLPDGVTLFSVQVLCCGKRVMLGWRIGNLGTPEQIQALEALRAVEVELPPGESEGLAWAHVVSPDGFHGFIEIVPRLLVTKVLPLPAGLLPTG